MYLRHVNLHSSYSVTRPLESGLRARYYPGMQYRRFGQTELRMPVLTCGGMRYQQTWNDIEPKDLEEESQKNLAASVRCAVDNGLNHIETARGYGSSEYQLGLVLPSLPREDILVQTKVGPADSEKDFLKSFELSLKNLQLDCVDLLAVHGINSLDVLERTLQKGTLKACRRLQDQGLAKHIGFSTHGLPDTVLPCLKSGEFEFVNLHWYYFDQLNWPTIEEAAKRDMGVLIISPNDKGGKLYDPPQKLVDLCAPFTPMGFNDLFCLSHPEVHTLSIGAARPGDYDAHLEILPKLDDAAAVIAPVDQRLQEELVKTMGEDWAAHWQEELPWIVQVPEEFPLYQVLRMYTMAKAWDLTGFGEMRYNLLGSGGHWFPGTKVDKVDFDMLPEVLGGYRFADRVPDILREAHAMFNAEDKKRLSQSED